MSYMTKTLGTATVALGLMAGIAATRTPNTKDGELGREKVEWDSSKSYVNNAKDVVGGTAKNVASATIEAADKATDSENTVPLAAATVLAGLGFVGAKGIERKRNQAKAEQAKQAEQAEQAKQAEELRMQKARTAPSCYDIDYMLIDLKRGYEPFDFRGALRGFGVPSCAKPFKKEGADENGKPVLGQDYTEYYESKDGKTIKVGIKYSKSMPKGVDKVDYSTRFVKMEDPTIKGKVVEERMLHGLTPDGRAFNIKGTKILDDIYQLSTPIYCRDNKYDEKTFTVTKWPVISIPRYEHQQREKCLNDFLASDTDGAGIIHKINPNVLGLSI